MSVSMGVAGFAIWFGPIGYFDIAGVLGGGTAAVEIRCASAVTLEVPMWPCSS
jgi:hypothetical protein